MALVVVSSYFRTPSSSRRWPISPARESLNGKYYLSQIFYTRLWK